MENIDLSPLDSYSYKPLRKQVYEVLRETILSGKLKPGEKITEVEIAEKLNVSRTPVREAIRMLELEELIVIVPQRGVFVAGVKSIKEINDIFEVRAKLEGLAAKLAAQNITEDQLKKINSYAEKIKECINDNDLQRSIEIDISFHQAIYEAANNKWLQKMLDSLFEKITRFRASSLGQEGRMKSALKEHKELCQAFDDKNGDKASKLARQHIEKARQSVVQVFEKHYK